MGTLGFGAEDHLECLQPMAAKSPSGESLCLGYRFTVHFWGLPAYVSNHGYVLQVVGAKRYYELPQEKIALGQKEGLLPTPMPAYHIPIGDQLFGYSLWPALALGVVLTAIGNRRKARSAAVAAAADANEPIITTGPVLLTKGDSFIQRELASALQPGERITHQAYALDRAMDGSMSGAVMTGAFFAALTDRRLFLIKTRVGAFSPLLENHGLQTINRAEVVSVERVDKLLRLRLANGGERTLWVDTRKQFSNQAAFRRDVPRLLGTQPGAGSAAPAF